MATDSKPTRTRQLRTTRGRKLRPLLPEVCRYLVAIEDWDWSVSFGINDTHHQPEPFSDFRHLQISGPLTRPKLPTVRAVELTFLPEARLGPKDWPEGPPTGVGSLSLNLNLDRLLQGLLWLPADALAPVLTILAAGRFRYVLLDGEPLRRRQAAIRHYHLARSYDEDEFPPDR